MVVNRIVFVTRFPICFFSARQASGWAPGSTIAGRKKEARAPLASGRSGQGTVRRRATGHSVRQGLSTSAAPSNSASPAPAHRRAPRLPGDAVALLLAQRLAQPSPQHGPQLVLHVEREPVVHPVPVTAGHGEDVGALAVGVVDDHVEHRHAAQRRRVLVG